jgi:hypothetical protein
MAVCQAPPVSCLRSGVSRNARPGARGPTGLVSACNRAVPGSPPPGSRLPGTPGSRCLVIGAPRWLGRRWMRTATCCRGPPPRAQGGSYGKAQEVYGQEMCQLCYSPRCPLYTSGLRRPLQRKRRRGLRLLCDQRTSRNALAVEACSSCVHFIRYWAWRGLRLVSVHDGTARSLCC